MIGEEGRMNASFVVGPSKGATPSSTATGVANTLSGVLVMWKAAKSLRTPSRKPFLGAVDGIIELDDGIVANSVLGEGKFRLPWLRDSIGIASLNRQLAGVALTCTLLTAAAYRTGFFCSIVKSASEVSVDQALDYGTYFADGASWRTPPVSLPPRQLPSQPCVGWAS